MTVCRSQPELNQLAIQEAIARWQRDPLDTGFRFSRYNRERKVAPAEAINMRRTASTSEWNGVGYAGIKRGHVEL